MATNGVNLEVAEVALDRANGHAFEKFAQVLFSAILGIDFVPLGGMHDGGADGLVEVEIFEAKSSHFIQITRQPDHRAKIRHTVQRLRQVGRTPKRLTYITAQTIAKLDQEQESLADELEIGITIRDRTYIIANLNRYPAAVVAFGSYLATFVGDLFRVGAVPLFSMPSSEDLRSAVVFLSQELENREGRTPLAEKIVDSLIIWALRDTDPSKGVLATRGEILGSIIDVLPAARAMASSSLDHRLGVLSSKSGPSGRQINIYKKEGSYCLPFSTRETVQAENASDETLRGTVLSGLENRAKSVAEDRGFDDLDTVAAAKISLSAIEKGFEEQGLAIARSIAESDDPDTESLVEIVVELVRAKGLHGDPAVRTADVALSIIRSAFYSSTESERRLFNRWSKTYALLFAIQNEPRIVEWMRHASTRFYLYVGSDIIIRALSERFLRKEDQLATNALEILAAAGSTLILAEPVLDEVWTHIAAADYEFRNHYAEQEPYLTVDWVQACSRLLIRTYLYAKMRPIEGVEAPRSWRSFIDNLLPFEQLHRSEGKHALKQYLLEQYKMEFESNEDLQSLTDPDALRELSDRFLPMKQHKGDGAQALAKNDALMVLSAYGKRAKLGEAHKPNPLGYRTWWLTRESSIRKETRDLVKTKGADYMMRPEFVMQYIALNPKLDAIRESYSKIFPSTLSISLGARVDDAVLHKLLDRLRSSSGYNEARLKVEAASLSNQLMSDFGRTYRLLP